MGGFSTSITISVEQLPGERHTVGRGGVLEGVGEAIGLEGDHNGEGGKAQRLSSVKGASGCYPLEPLCFGDGYLQFRAQSRHSHSWSNKNGLKRHVLCQFEAVLACTHQDSNAIGAPPPRSLWPIRAEFDSRTSTSSRPFCRSLQSAYSQGEERSLQEQELLRLH